MIADEGGKAINRFTGSVEAQEGRGKMADEDRMEIIKKRKIREFRKSKGM